MLVDYGHKLNWREEEKIGGKGLMEDRKGELRCLLGEGRDTGNLEEGT